MTVYDAPQNLLNVLGTFWSLNHPGPLGPEAVVEGVAQLGRQQARFLEAAKQSLSREQAPLYRQDDWYWLVLSSDNKIVREDGWLEWPLPTTCVFAAALMDSMYEPTVVLAPNSDFLIADGTIRFRKDPTTVLPTVTDAQGVQTVSCWLYGVQNDNSDVYNLFGYAVGLQAKTSRQYKQLMNAVYDAIVASPTIREISLVLSAATGIPVVRTDGEVVKLISQLSDRLVIATSKHVYTFAPGAIATVSVGDTVNAGDTLTDALLVQQLGIEDLDESVVALGIDEGLLSSCFRSGLIFDNKDVPLFINTSDASGFTKLSWPVGGRRDDVERFFDLMHARGVAEALSADASCLPLHQTYEAITPDGPVRRKKSTLAHLLDTRTSSYGEPTAANLPATINPCRFLARNVLREHAIFASVNLAGAHRDAAHLATLALHKIMPPEQTLIFQVALTPVEESITVDLIEATTGVALALAPLTDEVDNTDVDDVTGHWLG